MNRILLTGAAGTVGSLIRPLLAERYVHVVLTDIVEVEDHAENETFLQGDIVDSAFVARISADVDGVVHLAGKVGPEFRFDDLLGPNMVGTHNVFAAARAHGISHVVYASSHHAVGFWRRGDPIDDLTRIGFEKHNLVIPVHGGRNPARFAQKGDAFGKASHGHLPDGLPAIQIHETNRTVVAVRASQPAAVRRDIHEAVAFAGADRATRQENEKEKEKG